MTAALHRRRRRCPNLGHQRTATGRVRPGSGHDQRDLQALAPARGVLLVVVMTKPNQQKHRPPSPIDNALWLRALAVHAGEPPDIDAELAMLIDEALVVWPPTALA